MGKFSIDDIIAEYTEKKKKWAQQHDDADNGSVSDEAEAAPVEEVSPIIPDEHAGDSVEAYAPIKDAPEEPEDIKLVPIIPDERGEGSSRRERSNELTDDEAEQINFGSLAKARREHGEVKDDLDNAQTKRIDSDEIDFTLAGNGLAETAELRRPKSEEQDHHEQDEETYHERSRQLKQRRQKKIDTFLLKQNEEDADNEDADTTRHTGQHEFERSDDEDEVLSDILQVKSNLTVRMCVLLCTGIFSLLITLANDFSLPLIKLFDKVAGPSTYLFTNTILGLIAISISYTVVVEGIKNLLHRRADCDSIAAVAILIPVISGIATLFEPSIVRQSFYHVYTSAAIMGLIFNTLGKLMIVKRTERNFRFVASDFERYALVTVDDEDTAEKFTGGVLDDFPELTTMKKTEFIKDFMKNSYSTDISDAYARRISPLILIASIAVGLLSLMFEKNTTGTTEKIFNLLAVMSGTLTLCSSFSLMLLVNIPLGRAQNKYLRYSGVMLGYSAVDRFSDTNSVLIDAEQLFPKGTVDLKNLKVLGSTKIEECILFASSLACRAGSVLTPTFHKILRGKTDMLYPVESYIYEDGLGLSGWIENKRILLGSRELMENHSIEGLPTKAKEAEYAKGNIVMYLSVSGVVSMLFVVQAKPSVSVSRRLCELGDNGIVTVIRTVDGFISLDLISKLFGAERHMLKLLPFSYHKDHAEETDPAPEVSSSLLCSGHFPSFAMLLIGTKRLKQITALGVAIQAGACALGFGIAAVMTLLGTFGRISPSFVFIYNIIFLIATLVAENRKV